MTKTIARLPVLLIFLAGLAGAAGAQTAPAPGELAGVSIEDLLNVTITSAARKEQRVFDTPAAVYVITQSDIRRSGMTSLPDLLRLAPGVDVAQINSNEWAVSVRGFNGLYANKLLVLIDGRSVYNRIFSGVLWNAEDLMVDDIDRIEVIRGPGAAIWGANAVNGVINIVTKAAADTRGGLVRLDAGGSGEQGVARYGGNLGSGSYRVYTQWTGRDQSLIAPGTGANDASHSTTTGFRADWIAQPGAFTLEGDFTAGQQRSLWPNLDQQTPAGGPIANDPSDSQGGHLLGRWTRTGGGGASMQVQSFVDIESRQEPLGDYRHHVFDIDTQYHTTLRAHQDLVAGVGYRFSDEVFAGGAGLSVTPAQSDTSLLTAFVQDEIDLARNRLAVTLGTQAQYDSEFGAGLQPTARAMWKGLPHQRVWAAASRALRTPSLYEQGVHVDFPAVPNASGLPLVVAVLGNQALPPESLVDAEVGHRLEIGTAWSIDVTGFVGRYDHLRTNEQAAPIVQLAPSPEILVITQYGSLLRATTRGLEVAAHWTPVPVWRLDGTYTGFHYTPQLAAASLDSTAATGDASAPRTQWQVRSAFSPITRATLNIAIFRVGPLAQLGVDAYTRADINVEWRFSDRLSAMAIGQNLFDAAHPEFATAGSLLLATQVPRSASVRLVWRTR